MIYSDEDKIDLKGKRYDAFFKPDWSPDTFLSNMYTCHFGVFKKSIIDNIGGFREGYEGGQDYDLVLRVIEKTNSIHHIPKILYHWRAIPGSTASSIDGKKYASKSAKKSLSDYLIRNNIPGTVLDGMWVGSYRVKRDIGGNPLISIIIPTRDKADVLKTCIDSILSKTSYPSYEIIIVNNQSVEERTLDYFDELKREKNIRVLDYDKEFNFSSINNYAAQNAAGDIIVFLNNDTEVISPEWLTAMLEHAQRSEVGAVGCKLIYPNGMVQHAGLILGLYGGGDGNRVAGHGHCHLPASSHGYFGRINIVQDISAVTAACMMMRKEVLLEVGGFDDQLSIAFNDVDLCLKIRQKGYLIIYTPYASLYHHESLSRGQDDTPEKYGRFVKEINYIRKKWGPLIDSGDPYYNPNLSLKHEDFRINI
jgi:GT2 family glycosyltransferase